MKEIEEEGFSSQGTEEERIPKWSEQKRMDSVLKGTKKKWYQIKEEGDIREGNEEEIIPNKSGRIYISEGKEEEMLTKWREKKRKDSVAKGKKKKWYQNGENRTRWMQWWGERRRDYIKMKGI